VCGSLPPSFRLSPVVAIFAIARIGLTVPGSINEVAAQSPSSAGYESPVDADTSSFLQFQLQETTIPEIHHALESGELSCVELVRGYLARVEAYDRSGPGIRSILTLNDAAVDRAANLDARRSESRDEPLGALHCIPVVVKDNINTQDMPTTGGSLALASSTPPEDAFTVTRLRAAGAIILGKGNLNEFALGGDTSSLGGTARNPYDLTRVPGGSSWVAAGISANLAVVGLGTDTGQSIRSPASATALVGVRPTRGLVSRDGVIPISLTMDEVGPLTRTAGDAARTLEVLAGFDPADSVTALAAGARRQSFTSRLDDDAFDGARIGVLEAFFGADEVHEEVNAVVESAMEEMRTLGAELVPLTIVGLDELTEDQWVFQFEFREAFNSYLAALGGTAPVATLRDVIASGRVLASTENMLRELHAVEDGLDDHEYLRRLSKRETLKIALLQALEVHELDGILYPHQRRLVSRIGEPELERNGVLAHGTGLPAVTFPAGFSSPTEAAPQGVPVGIELLGRPFSEPVLLGFAHAFEQAVKPREAPARTPALSN